jgi:hypothetical protein
MFFVSDAQFAQKGGVKCPSCLAPVKAPGAKPAAAKAAAPKAAPPSAAPATASAFESVGRSGADSRKKLIIIGSSAAAGVVVLIVILIVALSGPKVDYDKQAAETERNRKRAFEEISAKAGKDSFAPLPAATPEKAKVAPAPARPTGEYKPMAPVTPPPATTPVQAPPSGKTPVGAVGMNVETVNKIRTDVLVLHPFYLGLVLSPSEKARAEGILGSGKGVPEDADFLQSILTGGKLKAVRDEMAAIAQALPTLERESQEGLPVDKITYVGGRTMNCKIIEESPEIVKVERRQSNGVGGQLPIPRDNILRVEKGKGIGAEFPARWEAALKGSVASQVEQLVWCKENNLVGQAKMIAYTIVRSDPSNTQARIEAALPADPVKFAEDMAKGGVIVWQGKNWNPKELKEKLLKDGNALMEGQWFSKKERMITVPGLFNWERQKDKPVNFGGTPLCHDLDITYKTIQDVASNSFVEQPEVKFLRRFYAPEMKVNLTSRLPPGIIPPASTYDMDVRFNVDEGIPAQGSPMKSEVTINVPIGAPLLEASVITIAEVKAGGSITVYLVNGSGENEKRTKLYMCDPKESQSHIIPPDLIRGLNELNLVAVIEETASYQIRVDRRHVRGAVRQGKVVTSPAVDVVHHRMIPDYKAVLFPSTSNTVEVFRLRMWTADPSPGLNKLFASNTDVLK